MNFVQHIFRLVFLHPTWFCIEPHIVGFHVLHATLVLRHHEKNNNTCLSFLYPLFLFHFLNLHFQHGIRAMKFLSYVFY
jgi:hypothetical protein